VDSIPADDDNAALGEEANKEEQRSMKNDELLNITTLDLSRKQVGWDIVSSVKRLIGFSRWRSESKTIIQMIFTLGGQYFESDSQVLAPETEALWRIEVYKRMGISGWPETQ
jgi:hypothetical protein